MGIRWCRILKGDTLVSLPDVSLQITQSVIPITSVLFVIAELLRLPELLREARRGPLVDHESRRRSSTARPARNRPMNTPS